MLQSVGRDRQSGSTYSPDFLFHFNLVIMSYFEFRQFIVFKYFAAEHVPPMISEKNDATSL